eukprot:g20159.t1
MAREKAPPPLFSSWMTGGEGACCGAGSLAKRARKIFRATIMPTVEAPPDGRKRGAGGSASLSPPRKRSARNKPKTAEDFKDLIEKTSKADAMPLKLVGGALFLDTLEGRRKFLARFHFGSVRLLQIPQPGCAKWLPRALETLHGPSSSSMQPTKARKRAQGEDGAEEFAENGQDEEKSRQGSSGRITRTVAGCASETVANFCQSKRAEGTFPNGRFEASGRRALARRTGMQMLADNESHSINAVQALHHCAPPHFYETTRKLLGEKHVRERYTCADSPVTDMLERFEAQKKARSRSRRSRSASCRGMKSRQMRRGR